MDESWLEKLRWTLAELDAVQARYPDDHVILSAISQVRYLIDLAEGTQQDDSRLEETNLGKQAIFSLCGMVSSDLSEAMCEISDRVRRQLRRQGRGMNTDR